MEIVRTLAFVVASAGVVLACSGGGGSGGGGASTADAFIAEVCQFYQPCCEKAGKGPDPAKCKAFYSAAASGGTYDAAKGDACLAGMRAESANGTFCEEGTSDATGASCEGVFTKTGTGGSKQPGDLCEDDDDCAPSAEGEVECQLTYAGGASTATCQVRVRAKEGDACVGYKDGDSTFASTSGTTDGPPPPKVAVCWTEDGLFCSGIGSDKKCARSADVGGDCPGSQQFACVKSAMCDLATMKCVAKKAAGEACTGGVSATSGQNPCVDDHYCKDGTCAPLSPTGAACAKSNECKSSQCTNGKCAANFGTQFAAALLCGE